MGSLTQIAITARRSIRYIILFIIFLSIGRVIFVFGINTYLKIFPPAPAPPTVKFGKLTQIDFPKDAPTAKLNFTLETVTGGLPTDISGQAKVYFMPKLNSNLLALDNAKSKAQKLGFDGQNPIFESDTLYQFNHRSFPSTMEMNIVTGNFSVSYDLAADPTAITNRPTAAEIAAANFKNYLSAADALPEDLSGPITPGYLKLQSGALAKVLALSEADVTKVNLFRKPYDKLPSLTGSPNKANIWAIISGTHQNGQEVISAEYHYFPVDESQFSTYPLITPSSAYETLQNGNGFIANLGQYKSGDNVKIRNVYLAYFDPATPSDFYQPIYVFDSSDNDPENSFIGYVPAIDPNYYATN